MDKRYIPYNELSHQRVHSLILNYEFNLLNYA